MKNESHSLRMKQLSESNHPQYHRSQQSTSYDMAFQDVADQLSSLNLSTDEYLLYNPSGGKSSFLKKLDNIPRYLFRVFTPKSAATTDESWARSWNARHEIPASKLDIFANTNDKAVADMVHRHLMWLKGEDNFVSWTSSLLFTLVYIFHLHANRNDASKFDEINLCIIDTTRFPRAVFIRDLDLIDAYRAFDDKLAQTQLLRRRTWGGRLYFGEYLSQGELKIKGKCAIISAAAMIQRGLYYLHPSFREFAQWPKEYRPPWVLPVLDLRENIDRNTTDICTPVLLRGFTAIIQLLEAPWRLPTAIHLIASLSHSTEDVSILGFFKGDSFTDTARIACSPFTTKTIPRDFMPEIQQAQQLTENIFREFCLLQMTACVEKAGMELRSCRRWRLEMSSEANMALHRTLGPSWDAFSGRLNTVKYLSEGIASLDTDG